MADQFTLQHGGSDQFLEQWGIVPQPAIPFTTPDDNGKVLGVSNGQYALVSGGGGGGVTPLIVEMVTEQSADESVTYLNETGKNIYDAYLAGTPVIIKQPEVPVDVDVYCDFYVPLQSIGLVIISEQNNYSFMFYNSETADSVVFYAYGDDVKPTYSGGDSGGGGGEY